MRSNRTLVVIMILALAAMVAGLRAQRRDEGAPVKPPTVLFMCPHGAAKSVLASSYFERLAKERGLNVRVESAGTGSRSDGLSRGGRSPAAAGVSRSQVESAEGDLEGVRISRRGDFDWL